MNENGTTDGVDLPGENDVSEDSSRPLAIDTVIDQPTPPARYPVVVPGQPGHPASSSPLSSPSSCPACRRIGPVRS